MLLALLIAAAAPVQAAAPPPAPSAAAVALGERLARHGFLATLMPLQQAKDEAELIAAHPELTAAEQARLRQTARAEYERLAARAFAAEGQRYAALLSEADLQTLVAQADSPAAQHLHAALPQVVAGTAQALAGIDYKGTVLAAFCRETGKACPGATRP